MKPAKILVTRLNSTTFRAVAYGPYVRRAYGRGGGRTVIAHRDGATESEARERLAARVG
jgi:hypothetical protein